MKAVRLILGIMFVLSFVLFFATPLRAQDKFEAFGGYSYLGASVNETGTLLCPFQTCPTQTVTTHPNLNGWEGSFEYKPAKEIGIDADFGGYYGSLPSRSGGGSIHTNTYLFGPRVSFPGRISPFVHVLAGVAHQSTGSGTSGLLFFPPPAPPTRSPSRWEVESILDSGPLMYFRNSGSGSFNSTTSEPIPASVSATKPASPPASFFISNLWSLISS